MLKFFPFIIKHYLLGMVANEIHPELEKIVKLWKIPKFTIPVLYFESFNEPIQLILMDS